MLPLRSNPFVRRLANLFARRWLEAVRPWADVPVYGGQAPLSFDSLVRNRHAWFNEYLPPDAADAHANLHAKDDQKLFARHLGVPTAETYLADVPLAEALAYAEREGLERFVVKPVSGRDSVACFCLVREGDRYVDLTTRETRTLEEIEVAARRAYARLRRPDSWLVEELLLPYGGELARISDYKVYTFGGRVEAIFVSKRVMVDGKPARLRQCFDRDWEPVQPNHVMHEILPPVAAPVNGKRIVEMAEHIGRNFCAPFIRVDLYDTSRGVVVGELTPGPGDGPSFNGAWNYRFTKRWYEAQRELEAALRAGTVKPLAPTLRDPDLDVPAGPSEAPTAEPVDSPPGARLAS